MSNPEAKKNLAKDVERKPAPPIAVPPRQKSYVLPEQLRQVIAQALLSSSPKRLSVSDVNQILNDLDRLREVKPNE